MNKKQDIDAGSLNHQLIENDLFKNSNIQVEFFNNLRLNIINLKKGEILFREGDFANSIFLILDGDINLINKHDVENNCLFYTKNNFFGSSEFLQLIRRNSTAVALRDSRIVELSREDIDYLKTKDNSLMKNLQHERAFDEVKINLDYSGNFIKNSDLVSTVKPTATENANPIQHSDSKPKSMEDSQMNNLKCADLNKIKLDLNSIINNLIEHSSILEEEQKKIRQLLAEYESDNKKLQIEIGKLKEQKESFINLNKEKTEILGYQSYRIIELEKEITNVKSIEEKYSKNLEYSNTRLVEDEIKIKSLETELEEKKRIVASLEKNFEESKKTLSYLNEVQLGLIQKADEQEEIVKEQNIKLANSLERIDVITYDLQQKETFIAELKNVISGKDKLISELNEKGNNVSKDLENIRLQVSTLTSEITQRDSNLAELRNELLEKSKSLSSFTDKEQKVNDELRTFRQQVSALASEIAQKDSNLAELRKELLEKSKSLSEFSDKEQKVNDKLRTIQQQVSALTSEIAQKDLRLTEFDSELAKKDRIISELGEKEEKLNADLDDLQKKAESLTSELATREELVSELKNDLQNKSSIISEHATHVLQAQDELNKLCLSNSAFEEAVKQQAQKITELQNELLSEKEKEKSSRAEVLELQKKLASFEEQLKNVQKQSAQKDETIKKSTFESKSFSDNLKQKDSEIDNRNRTIDELKNELLTLKKSSENFSNKENALKKELVDLKFHLSKANSKLASFAEQIGEKSKLDERREKEVQKQLENQSLLLKEKDREVGDLLLLLQQRENEAAQLNKFKEEQSSQKSEYDSLNDAFGRLKNENTYLSEQLKNLKQQIEAFRNDQNNLLRISADYNRLKDEEEKYKNSIAEHDKFITKQKEEHASLNKMLNVIRSENEHLVEQLNNFKLQIKENENEFNKLLKNNVEYNRLKEETERHKKVLAEKEQFINDQRNVIDDLKLNNSEILHTLNATKNKIGDEVSLKENRISILENSLNDLRNALEEKTAFEDQQTETINNQAEKIAELELKLSEKKSLNVSTSSVDEDSAPQLNPIEDIAEEQSEISDEDKIFSKCKLIKSKPIDPDVMHETFEHFQYFDIHIVNVNLTRATIDMVSVFNEFLQEIVGKDENRIIVNLSQCEFIDSSFLGLLVANLKKVTAMGGDMRLVGFHPTVASMMQLTRMDKIFEFYPKVESALKSFG